MVAAVCGVSEIIYYYSPSRFSFGKHNNNNDNIIFFVLISILLKVMFLMNTSSLHMVVHFYSGGYFLPCSSPTGKLTRHVALSRQYNPLRSLIVSLFELWGGGHTSVGYA